MHRVLCLHLPNWPVQRLRRERPGLVGRPLLIHAADSRRGRVLRAVSVEAAARGARAGMPLAEAGGLGEGLLAEEHQPEADREALLRLAQRCEAFSPRVGLTEEAFPESLLLDIRGVPHLFGGEQALAREVAAAVRGWGWEARVAVADTIGAAWGLAWAGEHVGDASSAPTFHTAAPASSGSNPRLAALPRPTTAPLPGPERSLDSAGRAGPWIASRGETRSALAPLPLAALRLPEETLLLLARLGLRRIGELLAIPRPALAARFHTGENVWLLRRLDQALGLEPELITPHRPPPRWWEAIDLEHPARDRASLETALAELLEPLAARLAGQGTGALTIDCLFQEPSRGPRPLELRFHRPTADAAYWFKLLRLRLERTRLPAEISRLQVEAVLTGPLPRRQRELFPEPTRAAAREWADLIDRLTARLGAEAVRGAELVPDAQPELAFGLHPLTGRREKRRRRRVGTLDPLQRPPRLWDPPRLLVVEGGSSREPPETFHWQGRREQIMHWWGPERIETRWWRGGVCRDYFRVETETGGRFWLFRSRRDGRWRIQGEFG